MLLMEPPTRAEVSAPADDEAAGATWLLARLDALAARFALPTVAESSLPLPAEAVALAQAGMAETALVACIAACVSRHADGGPAVAHGPWADSALLAFCGAVLVSPADGPADEVTIASDALAAFLAHICGAARQGPLLLLPEALDAALLDAIAAEARRYGLSVRAEMRAGMAKLVVVEDATGEAAGAAVTLGVSRLWRGICLAARLLDEHHGYLCHPLMPVLVEERAVLDRLSSPWATALPETPTWLAEERHAANRVAWECRWLDGAGQEAPEPARAALRARAALVWQFASFAALDPALAWLALLSVVEPMERSGALAAARRDTGFAPVSSHGGIGLPEAGPEDTTAAAPGTAPDPSSVLPSPPEQTDQGGATPANSVIGRRAFRYGEQDLQVLALAGSASLPPAPRLLLTAHDAPTDGQEVHAAPFGAAPGGAALSVSAELARALAASRVMIHVPLTGERVRDVDLLNTLAALMRTHEGPQPVRVLLARGEAWRTLDRPGAPGLVWSSALATALAALLGPGHAALEPIAALPGPDTLPARP